MSGRERLKKQLCAALGRAMAGKPARPPEAGLLIWNTFMRLSARRTAFYGGVNPIQPSEVEAYCRLTRQPLEPHHVEMIFAMDNLWLERALSKETEAPEGVKTLPQRSSHGITPALFDAAFA